ncbi:FGGY-family carbohydrate kinase [Georgenia alba]|uniref:ATP:glycerol 3-phosphotransferase n=1 Tax=Georgenia alba TaxID=2233858 RepID=A0ABW2QEV3_9MICO
MSDTAYVLAVDQGTSSTKAVALSADGAVREGPSVPLSLAKPRPGWVEQDPLELLESVRTALTAMAELVPGHVGAIGLSTQRESALAWDAKTGEPLAPVLGWQDRRTAKRATELKADHAAQVRATSGLPIDPMFSALKFEWLLNEIDPDRSKARRGRIRLGTVDSWLVYQLTGGFQIEAGNASRTQLLDVRTGDWDEGLLELFDIPRQSLPDVVRSDLSTPLDQPLPGLAGVALAGVLGDSHAALFAHGVREPGTVKTTYGTGSSVMGLTDHQVPGDAGLVETLAWQTETAAHAFEGNILATGATLVWLSEILGRPTDELAVLAESVPDSGNVNIVPAFSGLGAPWWDEQAVAIVEGFDLGSRPAHLARAAMESVVLQIEDVLTRADDLVDGRIATVLADGGPASNDWLMQCQADLSDRKVIRPAATCLSALGAAHMAGLGIGLWSEADLDGLHRRGDEFAPSLRPADRLQRITSWAHAVARSRMPVPPLADV